MTRHKLEILWTDNGGEYIFVEFCKYCFDHGIIHRFSAPYSFESNKIVERKNKSLCEIVRCLFHQSRLPKTTSDVVWSNPNNLLFDQQASHQIIEESHTRTIIYQSKIGCLSPTCFWYMNLCSHTQTLKNQNGSQGNKIHTHQMGHTHQGLPLLQSNNQEGLHHVTCEDR